MSARAATGIPLGRRYTLGELAEIYGGSVDSGAAARSVESIASAESESDDTDLVVVALARYVDAARRSRGILLCSSDVAGRLPAGRRWIHDCVWWVVRGLLGEQGSRNVAAEAGGARGRGAIDPTTVVGAGAIVHAGAHIGPDCLVGEHAVIYGGVELGRRVIVGAGAVVGRSGFGWARDPKGALFRIPHVGGVVIEDDVEIGALCTVDAGTLSPTRVARGAKLDAHVHIAHNVQIGEGVLIAAQAGFAGSAVLGDGVEVGGQAGVTNHARVGKGVRIAAKSGVIGDVPEGAVVAGFPAVPRMRWLRAMAALLRKGESNR